MKKWYCVTSTFDNCGNVTANITDSKVVEEKTKDIYNDWFESESAALEYIAESKTA